MTTPLGRNFVRRHLGRRLRKLREASNTSEKQVVATTEISRAKLHRIEHGLTPIKVPDVWALCRVYGVDGAVCDALAAMCPGTTAKVWWEEFTDIVPEWFRLHVDLEGAATAISSYSAELVPGELQTADYARAVYRALSPDQPDDLIDRWVDFRRQRQHTLFNRPHPPQLSTVLSEAVLRRQIGGPAVLRGQLARLRRLADLDHVDIRVLPWRAGGHAALFNAFRIFDFANLDDDPPVVYLQMLHGGVYLQEPDEIDAYRQAHKSVNQQSVPLAQHLA